MELTLFFSERSKQYYYVGDVVCDGCKNLVSKIVVIDLSYFEKGRNFGINYYCLNCIHKIKKKKHIEERMMALIVKKPPKESIPVFIRPKPLTDFKGSISCVQASEQDKAAAEDVDKRRCKVSFNPNRNKMPEYGESLKQLEKKDEEFSKDLKTETQIDEQLHRMLFDSKPVLQHEESKKLK